MTRKLVTIRDVEELRPIPGADLIELAIIGGWQCVVKKGEFLAGDKGVYFEVDSFVPATNPVFKFLEKNFAMWNGHYGARIRTIKLRGQLSQGLLLPLSQFPELAENMTRVFYYANQLDLSSKLGVVKWEREGEIEKPRERKTTWLGKKLKKLKYTKLKPLILWLERTFPGLLLAETTRPFPSFIPRTDEERVQNLIHKLDRNPERLWLATVKVDGSSMTTYYNRKKFGVCSRNLDLKRDKTDKFWATALKYDLERGLKKLGRNIAIQGELMGPGIQGNREKFVEYKYLIYKIWDIDNKRYLGDEERLDIYHELQSYGVTVDTVPRVGLFSGLSSLKTIDDFLKLAEGPSYNPEVTREGIVFEDARTGEKGFKVIATSYLLEKDK